MSGSKVAFQRARGGNPESGWVDGQEPLERPSQEVSAQGGSHSLCAEQGQVWLALGGDAFCHSLLLILGPVVGVVWAATSTATTTASALLGQQALPLGFVVCKMA